MKIDIYKVCPSHVPVNGSVPFANYDPDPVVRKTYYIGMGLYAVLGLATTASLIRHLYLSKRFSMRVRLTIVLLTFACCETAYQAIQGHSGHEVYFCPQTIRCKTGYALHMCALFFLYIAISTSIKLWYEVLDEDEKRRRNQKIIFHLLNTAIATITVLGIWALVKSDTSDSFLNSGSCFCNTTGYKLDYQTGDDCATARGTWSTSEMYGYTHLYYIIWLRSTALALVLVTAGFIGFAASMSNRLRTVPQKNEQTRRRMQQTKFRLYSTMGTCTFCFTLRAALLVVNDVDALAVGKFLHFFGGDQSLWVWLMFSNWIALIPPSYILLYLMRKPDKGRPGRQKKRDNRAEASASSFAARKTKTATYRGDNGIPYSQLAGEPNQYAGANAYQARHGHYERDRSLSDRIGQTQPSNQGMEPFPDRSIPAAIPEGNKFGMESYPIYDSFHKELNNGYGTGAGAADVNEDAKYAASSGIRIENQTIARREYSSDSKPSYLSSSPEIESGTLSAARSPMTSTINAALSPALSRERRERERERERQAMAREARVNNL